MFLVYHIMSSECIPSYAPTNINSNNWNCKGTASNILLGNYIRLRQVVVVVVGSMVGRTGRTGSKGRMVGRMERMGRMERTVGRMERMGRMERTVGRTGRTGSKGRMVGRMERMGRTGRMGKMAGKMEAL
jgi:hypothetical protein